MRLDGPIKVRLENVPFLSIGLRVLFPDLRIRSAPIELSKIRFGERALLIQFVTSPSKIQQVRRSPLARFSPLQKLRLCVPDLLSDARQLAGHCGNQCQCECKFDNIIDSHCDDLEAAVWKGTIFGDFPSPMGSRTTIFNGTTAV